MSLAESPMQNISGTPERSSDSSLRKWRSAGDSSILDRHTEARLIRYARAGDQSALERIIAANLRLVYKVARRYRCRTYTLEDLVQEGVVGLMCAVERFDADRGYRLSTYALHWIRQAIARAVEQNDRVIHVPMQATVEIRRLVRLREERQRDIGRSPSEAELARETGLAEERITQLLSTAEDAVSLEAMIGVEQDTSLLDMAEDPTAINPEMASLLGVYRQQLCTLVSALRPRERWVVEERFGLGGRSPQTLDELSRHLQVSRERVRQIEARAMQKLRHALRATHWD